MINWKRTDPENSVFVFESISVKNWGSIVEVVSAEDTEGNNRYKISFIDCREIKWDLFEPDEDDLDSSVVTIIGFDLGEEGYKTRAIINGGFFELEFKYKNCEIERSN